MKEKEISLNEYVGRLRTTHLAYREYVELKKLAQQRTEEIKYLKQEEFDNALDIVSSLVYRLAENTDRNQHLERYTLHFLMEKIILMKNKGYQLGIISTEELL